jgi:hypothetical protein
MTRRMRVVVGLGMAVYGAAAVTHAQEQSQREPSLLSASLAPLLASWIEAERDAAKEQGVQPIPSAIRAALEGYVPDAVLDRVRYREGAGEISLPQNMIRFGHATAVTLDDVIVFEEHTAALEDPRFWAHELKHVMQFQEWGVQGFATRYLNDSNAVETEANDYRWEFMKQAGLIPKVGAANQ